MNQDIYERLARMDRRIRVIGRITITSAMIGLGLLVYAACQRHGISEGWSIVVAAIVGSLFGWSAEREFDR